MGSRTRPTTTTFRSEVKFPWALFAFGMAMVFLGTFIFTTIQPAPAAPVVAPKSACFKNVAGPKDFFAVPCGYVTQRRYPEVYSSMVVEI